jgi:hypothetical protein
MKSLLKSQEDLTVLVFKDNSAARTFRVPMQWISKLGLIAGAIMAVAVLGIFLTLKSYLAAHQALRSADPAYVQDLEQEVTSLRAKALSQTQTAPAPIVVPTQATTPTVTANSNPVPLPTVTVTVTPTPRHGSSAVAPGGAFSALPSSTEAPPAAADSPISIYEPRVSWHGHTLSIRFFIQYLREDKGNQQGRIIMLARGPDTILTYPDGVLNPTESPALLAPEKGEYFSVSRVREVKTDFGPMKSTTSLREIEVFLFGQNGRLLVHQSLSPKDSSAETQPEEETQTTPDPVQSAASEEPLKETGTGQ